MAADNTATVVIILSLASRVVGIVVDDVSDAIALKPEQIKVAPQFGATLDTQYLMGLGTVNELYIFLISIYHTMYSTQCSLRN